MKLGLVQDGTGPYISASAPAAACADMMPLDATGLVATLI
jgi:hypothetical protein